jgi:hypothetical protein
MNFACRKLLAEVQLVNSIWATSFGRSQRYFFISSAVNAFPQRASFGSGRFANGHVLVSSL